jgi:hypothetical protein
MTKLLAGVLTITCLAATPCFAEGRAADESRSESTVYHARSSRRWVGAVVGAGVGVAAGLATGLKAFPSTTCRDGRVISLGASFGIGGALLGRAIGKRSESAGVGSSEPRLAEQPLGGSLPTYRFSTAALAAAEGAGHR